MHRKEINFCRYLYNFHSIYRFLSIFPYTFATNLHSRTNKKAAVLVWTAAFLMETKCYFSNSYHVLYSTLISEDIPKFFHMVQVSLHHLFCKQDILGPECIHNRLVICKRL